jgi:hypothetical protein
MYCPNCRRQVTQGQKFCKGCGLNLLTAGQTARVPTVTLEEAKEHQRRLNEVRHGVQTMFTGIGLAIFLSFILHGMGVAMGAMIFFFGLGRIASATVFATPRRSLEFRWPGQFQEQPDQTPLPVAPPPVSQESMPPSVTEHTTIRLEQPYVPPEEKQRTAE